MISLTIETGNSAFESDMNHEIARIIDAAADKILEGDLSPGSSISLRDFNGNNASVFRSAIDGVMNYDIPFAFEPFWEKASLTAAQKIAMDKGEFSVADPAQDKTHSGKVLGVTDHHVVVSLGRSALIVEKRDIDRVPAVEENVTLKFEGGKGVFQPPKDLDLGR